MYTPLWCKSAFSFLEGASQPEELRVKRTATGLGAIALTDRDGVHGMVRAHVAARDTGCRLIVGAEVTITGRLRDRPPLTGPRRLREPLPAPHAGAAAVAQRGVRRRLGRTLRARAGPPRAVGRRPQPPGRRGGPGRDRRATAGRVRRRALRARRAPPPGL